jgi:hypothetical protein
MISGRRPGLSRGTAESVSGTLKVPCPDSDYHDCRRRPRPCAEGFCSHQAPGSVPTPYTPQAAVHSESRRRLTPGCFRLPTETCIEPCNRHIHKSHRRRSHRRRALRPIGRAVAAGNKSRAGPPQTCLLQSLGWFRSFCRLLCQREGDSSGRETSIARTSLKCGSDYRGRLGHCPARPAPNKKCNGNSGVAPPGPRGRAQQELHPATNQAQARCTRSWTPQGSTYRCCRLWAALCPIQLSLRR